ncbi:transposase [Microcoleus sp. F10B5]
MKKGDKLIWALNYQSQESYIQSYPSGNGESTVKFIKYLQDKYKGRKIMFILDGASSRRFGAFKDFLSEANRDREPDDWSITCVLFAPNASQQNPVEYIWVPAKNFLIKHWYLCNSFKIFQFVLNFLLTILLTNINFTLPKLISTLIHKKSLRIAIVEVINNKLKLFRRSGFGFRNFKNFETRALLF